MAARPATWIAIAFGGAGGAVAAFAGSTPVPPKAAVVATASSLPLKPVAQLQASTPSATPAPIPSVSASAVESEPPKPIVAAPAADLLPLPTTKEALLRQEMYCDQRKAESCIVAARAFEGGSAGVTDPEKAAKYRRIALTAWISQCDKNSAAACGTLATMYRAGSGVPQNDRNADALIARARELCRFNDAPACHEPPLAL